MNTEIDNEYKRNALILAIRKAYEHSREAHDLVVEEDVDSNVALAYLNSAISLMNSAKAINVCMYDKLQDFDDIYHTFNVFSDEFLNSCATGHSYQWTDSEFIAFEETYKSSIVPDYKL